MEFPKLAEYLRSRDVKTVRLKVDNWIGLNAWSTQGTVSSGSAIMRT